MLEWLTGTDKQLFLWINSHHNQFFDFFLFLVSGNLLWIPLYVFLIWILWRDYKWSVIWVLLGVAILILIADQGSVHIFKNTVQRLRPCHDPSLEGIVHTVNGKCGGQFGFVSSHAANVFAVTGFLILLIKRFWIALLLIFWAVLVSFSRIYLGVHFPGDVLCGAVFGTTVGFLFYPLFLAFYLKITHKNL